MATLDTLTGPVTEALDDSTAMKIAIFFPGDDNEPQIEQRRLLPGTTTLDLLRDLNLTGYSLRKPDGSGFFKANDDVYVAMERANTSKLEAVPGMTVAQLEAPTGASSLLPHFVRRLGVAIIRPRPAPVVAPRSAPAGARPFPAAPPLVGRAIVPAVARRPVSFWQQQGWQQIDARTWRGRYRLAQGAWEGEIEQVGPKMYRPWMTTTPPREVLHHPHAICLFYKGPDRHMLHFGRDPTSVDAALWAMTDFLADSYAAAKGKVAA
jgi:hypothetical protein